MVNSAASSTNITTPLDQRGWSFRHLQRQNGYELSDRGRIPSNVIEAFETAHASTDRKK
jgi:hypothetical protein